MDRIIGRAGTRRSVIASGAVIALVASLLVAVTVVTAQPAGATTPGTPGTPQPPTVIFTEDFQNAPVTGATHISIYTSTGGGVYTAAPVYLNAPRCNGVVFGARATDAALGASQFCASQPSWWPSARKIPAALGQYAGMLNSNDNLAVAEQTIGGFNDYAGRMLEGSGVATQPGRFITFSLDVGNICNSGVQALDRFYLMDGTTPITLNTSDYNICVDPNRRTFNVTGTVISAGTFVGNRAALVTSSSIGFRIDNNQASGNGNDQTFDNFQVLDVTPQLDKAFTPSAIASGQTSTLTFTITNTSELAAKNGWSFTDNLPAGVTATGVNSTTCASGVVTAGAGSSSVVVSGNLNQGQSSCSVTVRVTAVTPGTYVNGPANFPAGVAGLNGLNPPADATLTVTPPASLNISKTTTTEAIMRVGQVVTYKFVLRNRGQSTLTGVQVTDTQVAPATQANMSAILCEATTLAPDASTTCVGTYTVTQADIDHGSLTDVATASGTDPSGAVATTPESSLTITTSRPSIGVVKTSTITEANAVGQQVPYVFRVTNTGNVTLFGIGVTDTQTLPALQANMSAIECPQPALAPGASQDCTGTYTVTLADLQNGSIADSAVATGAPEGGAAVTSTPSTLTIRAVPPGSLRIQKSSTTTSITTIGQQVPYTFTVTNSSTVTVTNVAVTDTQQPPASQANMSAVTCQATTLAAGATTTCTGTYTVTSSDIAASSITDTAVATGRDPAGNVVRSQPSTLTITAPVPSLTIVKSTTSTSVSSVGQVIPYTFTVRNTGNQALTAVSVADVQVAPAVQANMSAVTCQSLSSPAGTCTGTSTSLAVGQTATFTGSYTVTQADLTNGSVNDYATASGRNPAGTAVTSPQSSATVNTSTTPLTMVKAAAENNISRIGQAVHYTFTVTNNSSTTYRNLAINDTQIAPAVQENLSDIVCLETTLEPSATTTCTAVYTVTAADITQGVLADSATATATDLAGNTVTTAPSSAILPATQRPSIILTKTSTTTRATAVGQEIPYSFTVTNTGNVTVTQISVADTPTPPSTPGNMTAVLCPNAPLQPGQSVTCTGTYTVTRADLDFGTVSDSAVASAVGPNGGAVTSPRATLTITTDPALVITKTSPTAQITTIGQQVPYTFVVTNIRRQSVANIQVTDTQVFPSLQSGMSAIACDATALAPAASTTCRGTYTATAADIANGSVNDSAVATGTDSTGRVLPPSTPATLSIPTVQNPDLAIEKVSNTAVITAVDQRVTYQFRVTNTGNVTIDDVGVVDTQAPPASQANLSAVACPYPSLPPGETQTCTATYTVTAADIANRSVNDSAVATGIAPDGTPVQSEPDTLSIPAPAVVPALSIVKTSPTTGLSTLNQQISYIFTVTNNSTGTLTNVSVADTQIAPAVQANLSSVVCTQRTNPTATCSGTRVTLAAGQSAQFVASYTTTQPDFDNGRVDDSAIASGTTGAGAQVTSAPSTFSVPVDPIIPELMIDKASPTTAITQVGQQVPYTFTITNSGNLTLSGISVTDTVAAPSTPANLSAITCPATSLAPNRSMTCTATYTASTADLNGTAVTDTATAQGTSPMGDVIVTEPDTVTIPVTRTAGITIAKASTTSSVSQVGEQIPYTFTVTNTGNVTLGDVGVTDTVITPSLPASLTDVSCVELTNPVDTCSGTTTPLVAGQSATFTATYVVTQADLDHGSVNDTARASGIPPATVLDPTPAPVISTPSSVAVTVTQTTGIDVVKSSPDLTVPITTPGQVVRYDFLVRNTGNVTINAIAVQDVVDPPSLPANLTPVSCPRTSLGANEAMVCTATYTVAQDDIDNGSVSDTATATGTPATGGNVVSDPSPLTVPSEEDPGITVSKESGVFLVTRAGEVVPYTFTVLNTGNVTLTGVTVNDTVAPPSLPAGLTAVSCPAGSLIPGQSMECTASYTVSQADVDHGSIADTVNSSAVSPQGTIVDAEPDTLSIPVQQTSTLTLLKESTTTVITQLGQQVPYTFTVTNTGNTTLTQVTVDDIVDAPSLPGGLTSIACTVRSNPDAACTGATTSLAPGQIAVFTAVYTVTQADLDHGSVSDIATATAVNPAAAAVASEPSRVDITVAQTPSISVVKASTTTVVTAADQQVPYTFVVTNTGNVTLTGVQVTDVLAAPSDPTRLTAVTCQTATLAPDEFTECTATYTVTQADVDHGLIADTATATATAPGQVQVVSEPSTYEIPVEQAPGIQVIKSSATTAVTRVGEEVTYTFAVTNTGNVTLTSLTIDDVLTAPSDPADLTGPDCPQTVVAPGDTVFCTAAYVVTQADTDHGSLTDTATASATPPSTTADPDPEPVESEPSTVAIPVTQTAALTVAKSTTTSAATIIGQRIMYTFLVTNTGNVTINALTVTDVVTAPSDPANLSVVVCPAGTLASGESVACTATYTVTAADLQNRTLHDTATAGGTGANGVAVSATSALSVPAVPPTVELPVVSG